MKKGSHAIKRRLAKGGFTREQKYQKDGHLGRLNRRETIMLTGAQGDQVLASAQMEMYESRKRICVRRGKR